VWLVFCLAFCVAMPLEAQQFNSDSYLSKPVGTLTTILTAGQRNSQMMTTFSLLPRWEFTASVFIFNSDSDAHTIDGYTGSFFAKYMFYENKSQTGGAAVKGGTGLEPGYLDPSHRVKDAFKSYWMNFPATLPLLNNDVSIDFMPGFSATKEVGTAKSLVWNFTYTTRLAWYPMNPKWSLVGEIVGARGQNTAIPEWRAGWRIEPNPHVVFAISYDKEFQGGKNGAKWEAGVMIFTPQFLCIYCGKNHKQP